MSKRRRHLRAVLHNEALVALIDRLRRYEPVLSGKRLLDVRCGTDVGFGLLLEWLRPSRLVAVDIEALTTTALKSPSSPPTPNYGHPGSFDAAFLFARGQLKRSIKCVSLSEVARVLVPGGLFVVTSITPRWAPGDPFWERELDRSAEAWSLLHEALSQANFRVGEEHLGASRLLVAHSGGVVAFPSAPERLHLAGRAARNVGK